MFSVSSIRVVWVQPNCQKLEDTVDRSRLSVGADLKELVVVRRFQLTHPGESTSALKVEPSPPAAIAILV